MRLETQNRKETVQMIPDAPESTSGDADPAPAAPREPAPRAPGGNRTRLRRSLEFGEHAKSLRFRLAPLFGLDASPRLPRPAPGSPGFGPLYRRLRLRGDHRKTRLGRHPRAADLGAAMEFRAARRKIRPRRSARRHRP